MKKIVSIFLISLFVFADCPSQANKKEISIYYGISSYALFEAKQKDINKILYQYKSLSFEKTDKELDLNSAFCINISENDEQLAHFWVDKDKVFWLNGGTQAYRITSGTLDYNFIKSIYEKEPS